MMMIKGVYNKGVFNNSNILTLININLNLQRIQNSCVIFAFKFSTITSDQQSSLLLIHTLWKRSIYIKAKLPLQIG